MSETSKIDSQKFIQQMEAKKQIEAQKDIEDIINKLKNTALNPVQAKYEVAKLNTIAQDMQQISPDLKNKINDALNNAEKKIPEIKELIDKELLQAIEETEQAFTGEGLSTSWINKNDSTFMSSDEYDPYKIDGNSTLSTYL